MNHMKDYYSDINSTWNQYRSDEEDDLPYNDDVKGNTKYGNSSSLVREEPLKVGDVLSFGNPTMVAGHPFGNRTGTIITIKKDYQLRNGFYRMKFELDGFFDHYETCFSYHDNDLLNVVYSPVDDYCECLNVRRIGVLRRNKNGRNMVYRNKDQPITRSLHSYKLVEYFKDVSIKIATREIICIDCDSDEEN